MTEQLTVYLPHDDRVVLNEVARRNERSASAEARLAIRRHLRESGGVAVLERDQGKETHG